MTSTVLPHDLEVERAILGRMLLRPDAIAELAAVVTPSDFYLPLHGELFGILTEAWRTGEAHDSLSLVAHHPSLVTPGDAARLVAGAPSGHQRLMERLVDLRVRRALVITGTEMAAEARDDGRDSLVTRDHAAGAIAAVETPYAAVNELWTNFDEFIDQPTSMAPWVIPGMFRAGWRAMLIATEGRGKSVLSRQLAVAAACGIHPLMTTEKIEPVSTLLIDLENPVDAIVDIGRQMRAAAGAAWAPERIATWHQPGGIDVRRRADRSRLENVVARTRPQFVALGPLYKAYSVSARESDEQAANEVQAILDDLRIRYGFALLIEHHAPKANGTLRDLLPYGSSLWLRWPELGLKLTPHKDGNGNESRTRMRVGRFRIDRIKNQWPDRIDHGQAWPWVGEWDRPLQTAESERFW